MRSKTFVTTVVALLAISAGADAQRGRGGHHGGAPQRSGRTGSGHHVGGHGTAGLVYRRPGGAGQPWRAFVSPPRAPMRSAWGYRGPRYGRGIYRLGIYGPVSGSPYAWIPGYWNWRAPTYVWISGTWVAPPAPDQVWIPAHWVWVNEAWVWQAGYWTGAPDHETSMVPPPNEGEASSDEPPPPSPPMPPPMRVEDVPSPPSAPPAPPAPPPELAPPAPPPEPAPPAPAPEPAPPAPPPPPAPRPYGQTSRAPAPAPAPAPPRAPAGGGGTP